CGRREMECGCGREMERGCGREMERGCMKEMDHGCRREMECDCMKEMDHGCMKEMDHGCRKEMECGRREMECGCGREMERGCKKEMECCRREMECGCMKELSCEKEVRCECEMTPSCGCQQNIGCGCEMERGCGYEIERNRRCMDMNCGCMESCTSCLSHEEFNCLLHQLLQYEEGADVEFCKAKKDLEEAIARLQCGVGCNTKIHELYCMINEWLDCYEMENCQCSCNSNCREMRCELHEMVKEIHNLQNESCCHAFAACQSLAEAKKLTECMLAFREKVMRNCYPRQC
ncbi:hypothetical protein, partial [Lachnoclostridium sp.]